MKLSKTLCSLVLALAGCAQSGSSDDVQVVGGINTGSNGVVSTATASVHEQSPVRRRVSFVSKEGFAHDLDILAFRRGVLLYENYGQVYRPLRFFEAGEVDNGYNIELNDFFVLTNESAGVSRILQYWMLGRSTYDQQVYLEDISEGLFKQVRYGSNFSGVLVLGGHNFKFVVENDPPYRLRFDNNGDGIFNGDDEVPLLKIDGSKIHHSDLLPK